MLIKDFEICKEGSTLTPEQAKILELLDYRLASFQLKLKACWIRNEGFIKLSKPDGEDVEMDIAQNEDMNGS